MRVLWFTNTPSNYLISSKNGYNGGGWISSLEEQISNSGTVDLGIAFIWESSVFKEEKNGVSYYPINKYDNFIEKLSDYLSIKRYEAKVLKTYLKVIDDFNPDVIHIFGTEQNFGLICNQTKVPVIIHLQGLMIPYLNALLPPAYSKWDFIRKDGTNPINYLINSVRYKLWFKYSKREYRIFKCCKNYMGRTEWDKRLSQLFSPSSNYYYCSEMLRKEFMDSSIWHYNNKGKFILISTISEPLYKGADLILKTAHVLKNESNYSFEWHIYGIKDLKYAEYKTGIKAKNVNVFPLGIATAAVLKEQLLNCNLFIHPSYIDNSPNSVCEAQLLGVPVIACNTGGVSTIINHNITGCLVPANDPYIMASYVLSILDDPLFAQQMGENARLIAMDRHDPQKIISDLLMIYKRLL